MKIYNNIPRLPRDYTNMVDEYEHTQAYAFYRNKKDDKEAVFDVFFRKVPNNGGYAVMAGVDQIIEYIKAFNYGRENLEYFINNGYPKEYIEQLKTIKNLSLDIYAVPDGTPVFPNEPIVTVKGPLKEIELVETAILAILNGAMSHSTGARKIIEAVPHKVDVFDMPILSQKEEEIRQRIAERIARENGKPLPVMEFGARRADGLEAAINSSLYGVMAGCAGTSNIYAAQMLNMKALGTMAHLFIETYPTELEAFKDFAKVYPNNCILLVDTYDTLRSGVPNAIKTFNWMKENGMPTDHIGIRIDSGDLAYLSKEARKMMDNAGFPQAKICLSNGLDAPKIESLIQQGAVFDSLGVGDNISKPEGNMGCVYKEVGLNEQGIWLPKIKLSNDTIKIINPGFKKLYRAYDKATGYALADVMTLKDEEIKDKTIKIVSPTDPLKYRTISDFELKELQVPIFLKGKQVYEDLDVMDIQKYCNKEMAAIYPEVKRTMNPHEYHVSGTENYVNMRTETIAKTKKLIRTI